MILNSSLFLIESKVMLARVFSNFSFFATAKYEILNGKYLVPPAPKRPLSSYLIFSNEARKNDTKLNQGSIVEGAKAISEKWKTLSAEEKQNYAKKAAELRKQYEVAKVEYQAKFKAPFKKVNYRNLMLKQFYDKNKFDSLIEGNKAFGEYVKTLSEDDIAKYKKQAQEAEAKNAKITKHYEIPQMKYKDVNSYIRDLRKNDPEIPNKSQLEPEDLKKIEKAFQNEKDHYQTSLKKFASSFHITMPDLIKMLNKQKGQDEKLNEQGQRLKDLQKEERKRAQEQLKKERTKLAEEKAKIIKKSKKQINSKIKKLTANIDKKKKVLTRIGSRFSSKVEENKRVRLELELSKKAQKDLKKKQQQAEDKQSDSEDKQTENKEKKTKKSTKTASEASDKKKTTKKSTKSTKNSKDSNENKDTKESKVDKQTKDKDSKENKDTQDSKDKKEIKQESKKSQKSA